MQREEGGGNAHVAQLVGLCLEQLLEQGSQGSQCKGRQEDHDTGSGDCEELSLAPHRQEHVRELLQSRREAGHTPVHTHTHQCTCNTLTHVQYMIT